jgi:hypothetical protein
MTPSQSTGRIAIRIDVILLIVQFIVLVSAMAGSYAAQRAQIEAIGRILDTHLASSIDFVRADVWAQRNVFIDQKLLSIENKIDALLDQRSLQAVKK